MKTIYLDIMLDGRFCRQLKYTLSPLFGIDYRELQAFVLDKIPSLKEKDFQVEFSNNRVI